MNILNNLKSLAVIAIATMAFTSCSKEQTSLSIDDIQGKARIKGTLTYSEGFDKNYREISKTATNTTIWVKISNASLSPKGQAHGYTTFETATDAKGEYEIEPPVSENGTNIIIQPQAFTGKRYDRPADETIEGVFEKEVTLYSVTPNQIKCMNIKYGFTPQINN